jgi:CubicO group peptidase (beta-lactamase class C family)
MLGTGAACFCDPAALTSAAELQAQLERACRGQPAIAAHVGSTNDHGSFFAQIGPCSEPASSAPIRLGCLIKLFTGTLAAAAICDGLLQFDQALCLLPQFSDITTYHLLSHTHGLDSSALSEAPLTPREWIDIDALQAFLHAARRVSPPGLYSYGNAGAWLVAAALERLYNRSYSDLLGSLVREIDERAAGSIPQTVCAATAGAYTIPLDALIRFLRLHLGDGGGRGRLERIAPALQHMREPRTPIPFWGNERAVSAGWKLYGAGWFGHSVKFPDWSAIVRVNPARRAAYVVAAANPSAFLLQSRLFGPFIPDLRNVMAPARLAPERIDRAAVSACIGTYGNATTCFDVRAADDTTLIAAARVDDSAGARREFTMTLWPAGERMFIANPPFTEALTVAQFIGLAAGPPEYLWNGRQILRRYD